MADIEFPKFSARPALGTLLLLLAAPLMGTQASAQEPASSAPADAASWQAELIEQADGEISSFYAYRSGPLWIGENGPKAEAAALQELLSSAALDGVDQGSIGYAEAAAALEALRLDNSPQAKAEAELALSRSFAAYVQALRDTSGNQTIYEHDLLRPYVPQTYAVLDDAAAAPVLGEYLRAMNWMHPLYAQLRQAFATQTLEDPALLPTAQANLLRLRALPTNPGERYVLVDAGSATLWMYENGHPVDSMKVVVGTAATQTPMMAGYIRYASFNPYWNVPPELLRRNIAPRARAQGQTYLRRGGYQVVSEWLPDAEVLSTTGIDWRAVESGELEIKMRQLPSAANAMGVVKYEFPNPQGIYLHDTPNKELMQKDARQLSNGCIRLEDALRLGRWLMGGALPEVSRDPEQRVDLPTPVPIYVTYLTANMQGEQFALRDDPYGLDARTANALALAPGGATSQR
jgi:murein L,D-transpeptidase YcbB/YkuD